MADEADTKRRSFRLDAYTIIIIALIPSFMLIAAGATWLYERAEARRACEDAASYLASAAELAPSFRDGGTLADAGPWLAGMEALTPPEVAEALHAAATGTVQYGMAAQPGTDTTSPGAVYEAITPFRDSLDAGRQELVQECPGIAPQVSQAFPMFFAEDTEQP